MYLWDSNILRHFGEGHPNIRLHLQKISWSEIAIPSVVLAEVLLGRCDYALKASPEKLSFAHELLMKTRKLLDKFNIIVFDEACTKALEELQRRYKTHKRYADMLIAAMAKAGNHIVVTRNQQHFEKMLPKNRIANWVDEKPG